MLVHHRVTPSSKFAGTHLYTWVERGTMIVKCLAQEHYAVPRPGLEPGPPDLESSALAIRLPRLPHHLHVHVGYVVDFSQPSSLTLVSNWIPWPQGDRVQRAIKTIFYPFLAQFKLNSINENIKSIFVTGYIHDRRHVESLLLLLDFFLNWCTSILNMQTDSLFEI